MTREEVIRQILDTVLWTRNASDDNKNMLIDVLVEALEQEPATKNCELCRYNGSHHEVCNYCYKCSLWTEGESTTKNDLGVDCISRQDVLSEIIRFSTEEGSSVECQQLYCDVNNMPSVTPQEPFINKPCVSSGVCEHDKQKVLDKIRAEIEQGYCKANSDYDRGRNYGLYMATQIIDKYKTEK